MCDQERAGSFKQRPFGPGATLESPDEDSTTLEIHVTAGEQADLAHAQAVEVDQRKQRTITRRTNRGKEAGHFGLGKVARQVPRRRDEGQRRRGDWWMRGRLSAPFSRTVQSRV